MDDDIYSRVEERYITALYGKFLGKAPHLELVKASHDDKWNLCGEFHIADLPTGYFLIKCPSEEVVQSILFKGQWTVNGLVLLLTP